MHNPKRRGFAVMRALKNVAGATDKTRRAGGCAIDRREPIALRGRCSGRPLFSIW
jgi:hypothetical protein